MPNLSATFVARFDNFRSEVQKAVLDLEKLQQSTGNTQNRLAGMVTSFSGARLIEQAELTADAITRLGGAAKLTDQEAARANKTLLDAIDKMQRMGREVPDDLRKIAEETKRVGQEAQKTGTTMATAIGSAIGTFAGNLGSRALSAVTAELGRMWEASQRLEGVQFSYRKLTAEIGADSAEMLATVQRSTRGLVSELDIMQSSNKAMLLGLPVTSESMAQMAEAATRLGRAMGQDATKSLDDLITALGRSSPLILDNLGLTVKESEAHERYAESLGRSVSSLDESEKKMAFYIEAMRKAQEKSAELGESQLTLSERFTQAWTIVWDVTTRGMAALNRALGEDVTKSTLFKSLKLWRDAYYTVFDKIGNLPIPKSPKLLPEGMQQLPSAASQIELSREQERQVEAVKKAARESEVAAKQAADAQAALFGRDKIDAANKLVSALGDVSNISKLTAEKQQLLWQATGDALAVFKALGEQAPASLIAVSDALASKMAPQLETARIATDKLFGGFKKIELIGPDIERSMIGPAHKFAATATTMAQRFGATLREDLPKAVMGAILGGGSLLKAAGSTIGSFLVSADGFGKSISSGLTKFFGENIGKAIDSIVPMLGTLLGPALTKIGSWIAGAFGGVSPEVKKARADVRDFEASLAAGLTTAQRAEAAGRGWAATTIAVRDAYLAAGRTAAEADAAVQRLWDTSHPENARAAIEEINAALEKQREHYASVQEEVASLQEELGILTGSTTVGFKDMQSIAQQFGIDLSTLGPSFQAARIGDRAKEIIDAFETLRRGGADVNGALAGMADEISAMVQDAIRFGTALPENLRPMISKLAETGQLLDANGNAIADLSQINFGDPIANKFDLIADRMREVSDRLATLIAQLGNGLVNAATSAAQAIAQIGPSVDIAPVSHFGTSEDVTPGFAAGTISRGSWFRNFGAGTISMLHGTEAVVRRDQAGAFAEAYGSVGNETVAELRSLRSDMAALPHHLARAVRDAVLVAG